MSKPAPETVITSPPRADTVALAVRKSFHTAYKKKKLLFAAPEYGIVLPAASYIMFASHMRPASPLRLKYFTAVLTGKSKVRNIDVAGFGGGGPFDTSPRPKHESP